MNNAALALVGQTLNNRFVLIEIIGSGGMSVVFRALDLRQQEIGEAYPYLAVKILKSALQDDPRFFNTLAQEAKRAQALSHPNIINIFDFDKADHLVFITMELLQGQSLQQLIRQQRLPATRQDRLSIAMQILAAMIHAHQHGVVHADLKPGNIFIRQNQQQSGYTVTIFDFGISRALGQAATLPAGCSPAYATPRTVAGGLVGPYDDAYGLGCVLYSVLTGRHPYHQQSSTQVVDASRQLETILDLPPNVWDHLERLLIFPFVPNAFDLAADMQPVDEQDQSVLAQQQVLVWLEALHQSLQPKKPKSWQFKLSLLIVILCLCSLFLERFWFQSAADSQTEKIERSIQAQHWRQALTMLEQYDQMYHQRPVLSNALHSQLIQGLDQLNTHLMESKAPGYNPLAAQELLERSLTLFPDSKTLISLLTDHALRVEENKKQLHDLLIQAMTMLTTCESWQQKPCQTGITYFARQLQRHHPKVFAPLKSRTLQSYIQAYALAIYQKKTRLARQLQQEALFFFPRDQLESLGMFDALAPADIQGGAFIATALQPPQVQDHFRGSSVFEQFFNTEQRSLAALEQPWHDIIRYFMSFQQLWLDQQYPARSFAPVQPLVQPESSQAFDGRVDPCAVELGSQQAMTCQDVFQEGSGPLLRSLWLEKSQGINTAYRLAVAQYELSWGDLQVFCQENACQVTDENQSLPVYALSEQDLDHYLQWLRKKTGYTYRLLKRQEWQALADPLGLLMPLVQASAPYTTPTCHEMGYASQAARLAQISVYQGSFDQHGLYNLKDLSPEIVVVGAKNSLVPGRFERLRRCRIAVSAYDYPYAAYRLVRLVSQPQQ